MNVQDEQTRSVWMDVSVADAPVLSRGERADVVVVGSGIAGLSVAYELANRGDRLLFWIAAGLAAG